MFLTYMSRALFDLESADVTGSRVSARLAMSAAQSARAYARTTAQRTRVASVIARAESIIDA